MRDQPTGEQLLATARTRQLNSGDVHERRELAAL